MATEYRMLATSAVLAQPIPGVSHIGHPLRDNTGISHIGHSLRNEAAIHDTSSK
jgi:DMSO reductase anchor subunit